MGSDGILEKTGCEKRSGALRLKKFYPGLNRAFRMGFLYGVVRFHWGHFTSTNGQENKQSQETAASGEASSPFFPVRRRRCSLLLVGFQGLHCHRLRVLWFKTRTRNCSCVCGLWKSRCCCVPLPYCLCVTLHGFSVAEAV